MHTLKLTVLGTLVNIVNNTNCAVGKLFVKTLKRSSRFANLPDNHPVITFHGPLEPITGNTFIEQLISSIGQFEIKVAAKSRARYPGIIWPVGYVPASKIRPDLSVRISLLEEKPRRERRERRGVPGRTCGTNVARYINVYLRSRGRGRRHRLRPTQTRPGLLCAFLGTAKATKGNGALGETGERGLGTRRRKLRGSRQHPLILPSLFISRAIHVGSLPGARKSSSASRELGPPDDFEFNFLVVVRELVPEIGSAMEVGAQEKNPLVRWLGAILRTVFLRPFLFRNTSQMLQRRNIVVLLQHLGGCLVLETTSQTSGATLDRTDHRIRKQKSVHHETDGFGDADCYTRALLTKN